MTLPQHFREAPTKVAWEVVSSLLYVLQGVVLLGPFIVFVVLIQGPIYLYRGILTKVVAPWCRPRIGKAVTSIIQFQGTEFVDKTPNQASKYSIVTSLIFTGVLTLDQVQHLILEGWLQAKEENGEARYPEFRQYVEYWWGFMFWKEDSHFDVNDHLVYHKLGENMTVADSTRYHDTLVEQLLNTPYPRKRSPWEIHLIHNFKYSSSSDGKDTGGSSDAKEDTNSTLMVVRLHHTMADGYALTYALVEGLGGRTMTTVYDNIPRKAGFLKTTLHPFRDPLSAVGGLLLLIPKILRDFGFTMYLLWGRQRPWGEASKRNVPSADEEHGGASDQIPLQRQIYGRTPLIPISTIKFIKNKFRVSFSSVLLSCVGAAIAKDFEEARPVIHRESLRTYIGLPAGGHKNKLRNNILGAALSVDTTPNLSPTARLFSSEKAFQSVKHSLAPFFMFYVTKLLSGSLVYPFSRFISNRDCISVGVSNFPGPSEAVGVQRGESRSSCVSCDVASTAYVDVTFLILSYDGFIRIAGTANNRVLKRPQLEAILDNFGEEVRLLLQLAEQHP